MKYERSVIISTYKLHSGHCTAVDHRQSVSGVCAQLDQWERRYAPDKGFIYNFAMTLTQDLEKWFMVTALPVPKGTLWVSLSQNDPDRICSGQVISDGQVYYCMGPAEFGSNKSKMMDTLWRIQVSGKLTNYMLVIK